MVRVHSRAISIFSLILFALQNAAAPSPVAPTPAPRTVSTSRQFIVFGGDVRLRGSVAQAAEMEKSELLGLLQAPDRWSVPILLNLGQPQANVPEIPAVALHFSQTGAGLKIQLDLLIDRGWDPGILRREVMRALLLEMSYRALPSLPAGEVYDPPPDWLVDGILCFSNASPDLTEALESAAAQPPSLSKFLVTHPSLLDSQSRNLYRASAAAFLRLLLTSSDGRARLARYIADWPRASPDAMAELRAHFPALGKDDAAMEKIWKASLRQIASEQRFALFSFTETSQQLDECLRQNIGREKDGSIFLDQAMTADPKKIDKKAARALGQRFMLLSAHAHPLLRSIVTDYQNAAQTVARGKARSLTKRLVAAAALRKRVAGRMSEVDDYMNWFEATQLRSPSGAFRNYLRAAAETSDEVPRRHDPISVYLDAMETQVQ